MIWKLLRQHISKAQLVGFFFASLCGMVIVLLGIRFYQDVLPIFTHGDSFMKKDFVIVSKKVSTLGSLVGKSGTFTDGEITDLREQPFAKGIGMFQPARFKVSASMGMHGMQLSTAMFFESVPDAFVDIPMEEWTFAPDDEVIPIVIPRNYLNLYNFGFAQSRNLPQLSESMMGMITLDVRISGNGMTQTMKGRITGFSSRLNTILVPESFMDWANAKFGEKEKAEPSRLIVEVANPVDDNIARYFKDNGYETEDDKLDAGKTVWFLKLVVSIVLAVGLLISVLSFYILMLSVYLLLQKNASKLETLLLMGYSPARVALPYQILIVGMNALVLVLGVAVVSLVRSFYFNSLREIFPVADSGSMLSSLLVGMLLLTVVSVSGALAVRHKVNSIWLKK